MSKLAIKYIAIISLILGLILGVIAAIPYIGTLALFATLLLSAPIVVIYLIMDGKMDLTTVKDSIITGALIGFITNFAFALSYCACVAILYLFHIVQNLILTSMIVKCPVWLLLVFIIFVGITCAVTNAFSSFVTYYVINFIRDMYEQNQANNINDEDEE